MAAAMGVRVSQGTHFAAARASDSPLPSPSRVAAVQFRQKHTGELRTTWMGASVHSLCSNDFPQQSRTAIAVPRATASESSPPVAKEVYEVELEKPFGLKFYKGADGGTYIDAIATGGSADNTKLFTPGDKVLSTSAVFGNEMWPAAEYGRTMYTIRQRIGTLAMKMEKRNGVREDRGASAEQLSAERNAGQIGEGIREIQIQNYLRKMELKKQREEELTAGLKLYKAAKYDAALERFETVLGLKPEAREEAVASYNVACCYSQLNQIEAGISALQEAMEAGFDDYKTIRTDPDLANLRNSPSFIPLINKYDEPFINENAMAALRSVFGMFGKK